MADVVTGSAATLTPHGSGWEVRQGGPLKLWDRTDGILSANDTAGRQETVRLHAYDSGQHLGHPQMTGLPLPRPWVCIVDADSLAL
ncbi:hypothetical protein [Streptomyces sp. NPDC003032]